MFILSQTPSIANHFLAELRDVSVQTDRMRFRRNLERLGELLAYEISKSLSYRTETVQTPLAESKTFLLRQPVVLATILRASLPFHQGFLNMFDQAENAFIGAYRGHHLNDDTFEVEMDYITSPNLQGKTLILMDPMLATGRSLEKVYHALLRFGVPAQTHIASIIASQEGVRYLKARMPECRLWLGAVDDTLNEHFYIVPGLGDAGDLAFGPKE
ncbi:uracil phosphoribosyltransferase [Arundinibacter roseus]|uniref:Uracil phosphoribosyltransferase n=1 Tax=Arundinibacter roseus TaxID=2070510 RepID=A0A4R4KLP5_9BACT|nr:uracil phosphoribosyltransferase [Arundinibacter roseus]TDB69208.1 uracil phosphoribosyltransferase [Arundinibacter roseus]